MNDNIFVSSLVGLGPEHNVLLCYRVRPEVVGPGMDCHVCLVSHCDNCTSAIRDTNAHCIQYSTTYILTGGGTHIVSCGLFKCE